MSITFLSFSSFMYGQSAVVKQALLMSRDIVLPIPKEGLNNYLIDISKSSKVVQKHYLRHMISLENIIGFKTLEYWITSLTNWLKPTGLEMLPDFAERRKLDMHHFCSIYSALYSSNIYLKHNIPSLSLKAEMEAISGFMSQSLLEKANYRLFETISSLVCSNVTELTWEEIIDIRENSNFIHFTNKLSELRKEEMQQAGSAYQEIMNDLFLFLGEMMPHLSKSIIKGIICNLPLPPVNPFGIADSLRELVQAKDLKERFGYLFYMQEIKDKQGQSKKKQA